jgi:hypothetical protein
MFQNRTVSLCHNPNQDSKKNDQKDLIFDLLDELM